MPLRSGLVAALVAALATLVLAAPAAAQSPAERVLLDAVRTAGFDRVLDGDRTFPYPAIPYAPNVDVAVIRLDAEGRPVDAAQVLLDRDHPQGVAVPIGPGLDGSAVRYRRWDLDRFDGDNGASWTDPYDDADDVVPGRQGAPLQFLSPYPASAFKAVVGFWVARLADRGELGFADDLTYDSGGVDTRLCGAAGATTQTIGEWLDQMLSYSSNRATCALLKLLHDRDEVDAMNAGMAALGMPSLQVNGTNPATGGSWNPGQIHMGALDAAKLMLLVRGGAGPLFRGADGAPVTREALGENARRVLRRSLEEQGFAEVLSTSNWCGHRLSFAGAPEYPGQGIPATTPGRWVAGDGTVSVDGIPYPSDTRPCTAAAQVTFAHKTGLTRNYGSDIGWVDSLPGRAPRRYVIAVVSNVGNRWTDPVMNQAPSDPQQGDCWTADFICYSQAFARLGRAADTGLIEPAPQPPAPAPAQPQPPAPAPQPPAARTTVAPRARVVALSTDARRALRTGALLVTVDLPAPAVVELRVTARVPARIAGRRPRGVRADLARRTLTLGAGRRRVRVPLTRAGRRALRALRRTTAVSVQAVTRVPGARDTTAVRSARLRR